MLACLAALLARVLLSWLRVQLQPRRVTCASRNARWRCWGCRATGQLDASAKTQNGTGASRAVAIRRIPGVRLRGGGRKAASHCAAARVAAGIPGLRSSLFSSSCRFALLSRCRRVVAALSRCRLLASPRGSPPPRRASCARPRASGLAPHGFQMPCAFCHGDRLADDGDELNINPPTPCQ